jgi:hypothetical protein
MDSFKKIRRFIIFFIILYFASNFVCAKLMESKYEDKSDNIKIVSNIDGVEINFEEFSAAFSNGKVKGTVTNKTVAELVGKAIKMDFYSKFNNKIGTKYMELGDIPNDEYSGFATQFNYDNINRAEVYLIDESEVEDKSKRFMEWYPDDLKLDKLPWWAWVGGAIICFIP